MTQSGREILPQKAFREMERRDEQQIISELEGKYLSEFVYQFNQGERTVTGLSWAGIKEIAYRMGRITVDLVKMEETDAHYIVVVKSTDTERGNSRLGVSTQAKTLKRKDGAEEPDPFALQKAMSKAQRNAIRPLIPEQMLKTWINRFLEMKKTGRPGPARAPANASDGTTRPRKQVQSEQRPIPSDGTYIIDRDAVLNILEKNGLDPTPLDIWWEEGVLVVKPRQYLGDAWSSYMDALRPLGAKWVRMGRESRWEIKPGEAQP